MIIYLTPQGKSFNPNRGITIGDTQYPPKWFLDSDNQKRAGVTTKEVVEPKWDNDTQERPKQDDTGEYLQPAELPLNQAKENKLRTLRGVYEEKMQAIRSNYTKSQIDSWYKQEAEASAWVKDSSASTPFLDAMAAARGVEKAAVVQRIMYKSSAATTYTATQTGTLQSLEDAVEAATTNDELRAIKWPE